MALCGSGRWAGDRPSVTFYEAVTVDDLDGYRIELIERR
jgi:hypothetical protein